MSWKTQELSKISKSKYERGHETSIQISMCIIFGVLTRQCLHMCDTPLSPPLTPVEIVGALFVSHKLVYLKSFFFCELRLLAKFPNYRKTLLVVAIMFCLQHQRAAHASKRIWNMELILTKAFAKCITYQQMAQQTTHQMAHQHHIKMDNPDMIAVALNRQWFMVIISYNKVKKSKCFSVHLEISII